MLALADDQKKYTVGKPTSNGNFHRFPGNIWFLDVLID